jgi:FAD/FMN-containing dehydrogenase
VLHEDVERFTVDWTGLYRGGCIVLQPKTTEEVSKIMKYCSLNRIAVVPQGGNTGLVGGQVGFRDEIILSLEKMNQISKIDEVAAVITCDAGCILEKLNSEVGNHGFILPIDLGAKGSCHIGGNVATNAGGLRLLRYGSLHDNVLGLQVVQADGSVLNMNRSLHKDNCGYHLKNLFIGIHAHIYVYIT